jgi:CRISPR/Cas system CSM-associated protein Csm3 (group 7 of RAMP superfamily)
MTPVTVTFTWKIRGSLHMGTGMSRLGDVDRLIRLDRHGEPSIEGEQIKGAIRGSAERLIRWLGGADQAAKDSYPRHPVIQRLFAPRPDALVRFEPAQLQDTPEIQGTPTVTRIASTSIDHESGAAAAKTLRAIEAVKRGASFSCRISLYGDWSSPQSRSDILFLCAAVLCSDAIGSRAGSGFGIVDCGSITCSLAGLPDVANLEAVKLLESAFGEVAA